MFRLDADLRVYLHRNAVDFRLGINGLVALGEQSMQLDPFASAVYAFHNRRRNRIKLLLWDRNGFWMLLKRLEEDRFVWPRLPTRARIRSILLGSVKQHEPWDPRYTRGRRGV